MHCTLTMKTPQSKTLSQQIPGPHSSQAGPDWLMWDLNPNDLPELDCASCVTARLGQTLLSTLP